MLASIFAIFQSFFSVFSRGKDDDEKDKEAVLMDGHQDGMDGDMDHGDHDDDMDDDGGHSDHDDDMDDDSGHGDHDDDMDDDDGHGDHDDDTDDDSGHGDHDDDTDDDGGHGDHDDDTDDDGGHGDHDDDTDDDGGHGDHDDDTDDDGGHGDHDDDTDDDDGHGDHDDDMLMPPGKGASQEEIDTYLKALADMDEMHVHDMSSDLHSEHMAAMDLVPRGDADNVAIASGDWFDPEIWSAGVVPEDDSNVLIPEGVTVSYGEVSDTEIFSVRVDGKLEFATDTNSQMMFDTMVVSPSGHLEIGTSDNPVDPSVDVNLVVVNNGPIDTDWDPTLLSRGIISHGKADIHGAVKDSHAKVIDDPMAGDEWVTFDEIPEGWQIGDKIVIAGTHYDGYKWDNEIGGTRLYEPEDEVREITAIDGNSVFFDEPLEYDHDAPREDLKTSVANYTRNVSVETDDAELAEVSERGHVMFMHSDEVEVRYAEFSELGRTDKSVDSFDVNDIEDVTSDSNVQGRYSLHLHRTGVDDLDNPAIVEGNAVFGSPGWGFVHHDSNAVLTNNASYDTFGAGFVAETGNETGAWNDNIAIFAQGQAWGNPKNIVNFEDGQFDIANSGDGFWFQGRLIEASDNIAASVNNGFAYFHRGGDADKLINAEPETFIYGDVLDGIAASVDQIPILVSSGNEVFAAHQGLIVVKNNPDQQHDIWSHIDDFTAWSVQNGIHLEYTSHYILTDIDLVGKEATEFAPPETGLLIGINTSDIVVDGMDVETFRVGVDISRVQHSMPDDVPEDSFSYNFIDLKIEDVTTEITNFDPAYDRILTSDDLLDRTPDLQLDGPLTYKEDWQSEDGRRVEISGTKTDSLGETKFPSGTDSYDVRFVEALNILEEEGYWTTSDGQNYFLSNIYMTDRVTGEIFYETHPVFLDESVTVGQPWGIYKDAKNNGEQDFEEINGVTYAGDTPLDVAQPAVPWQHVEAQESTAAEASASSLPVVADVVDQVESLWEILTDGQLTHDETVASEASTDDADSLVVEPF